LACGFVHLRLVGVAAQVAPNLDVAADLPSTVAMLRQDVETMMEFAFASLDPERQRARDIRMVPPILERLRQRRQLAEVRNEVVVQT
jgi:hypothetical protein